jgi:hypothetical protein
MNSQKRKRGGQPGNRNARKHGFYSVSLDPDETCRVLNIINLEHVDPQIAVMRVKLGSVLKTCPQNRRVLLEACKTIAAVYAARDRSLRPSDVSKLKKFIRHSFLNNPVPEAQRQDDGLRQSPAP